MESGALSDSQFKGFASKVVPTLNIMTKVKGHPYDDLLTEKGYRGHPTLAFVDQDGMVLGRPLERTVASFESTLVAIGEYAALEKRLARGEKGLEFEEFTLKHQLSKLRGQKLVRAGRALKGLDAAQQLVVDRLCLGVEVDDLILASLGSPEDVRKAGKRMREILESGDYPDLVRSANAWSVLSRYGEQIKDAKLLFRCAKGLKKNFPDDERMVRWGESLEKKARAMSEKL